MTRLEYKPSSAQHDDACAVESSAAAFSPVLVGSAADAPARSKQSCWLGVAAYLSCGYCLFEAERLASASGQQHNYPKGYDSGSPQTLRFDSIPMLVGDSRLALTHQQHMQRGRDVQRGEAVAKTAGCTGLSGFAELDYFDYNSMFPLPTFHMLLYGLCRDFWGYTLRIATRGRPAAAEGSVGVVSNEQRRLIIAALMMIMVTSDFGRPPKDVCKHFGLMQLEDWLHFAETLAPLILIPNDQVRSWVGNGTLPVFESLNLVGL